MLEGLDSVRVRTEMYVGSTGAQGLYVMVWNLVYCWCLDEHIAGFGNHVAVTLNEDGSVTVEDDGRGMPIDVVKKSGQVGVDVLFTTLGCPTGFELAVVNALSEKLEVEVFRDCKKYRVSYQRGRLATPLECVGDTEKHGTRITFSPDKGIFSKVYTCKGNANASNANIEELANGSDYSMEEPAASNQNGGIESPAFSNRNSDNVNQAFPHAFDFDELSTMFRELAFLNRDFVIELADPQNSKHEVFSFKSGLLDYISWLNDKHTKMSEPIYLATQREFPKDKDILQLECAIQWTDRNEPLALVFYDSCHLDERYQIIADMTEDLALPLNEFARSNGLLSDGERDFSDGELRKGISTIMSAKSPPDQLRMIDKHYVRKIIAGAIQDCFRQYLHDNDEAARALVKMLKRSR